MRLLRRILIGLAAALLGAATPAASERIVAVGDLHGDYQAFLAIVEAAGISDEEGRWTGGDAVLVQLGDVTDRGPDSLRIIRHLQKLETDAPKGGGRIVVLVGNHEAMNVTGDLRFVHPGEYAAFATRDSAKFRDQVFEANRDAVLAQLRERTPGLSPDDALKRWREETPLGMLEHRRAWQPSGELGKWIAAKPAIARIGDTLFVHGGISLEITARPIEAVNADVAAKLVLGDMSPTSILNDELGPLWYRGNIARDPVKPPAEGQAPAPERPSIEEELTRVLGAYQAKRLVIAHTPHPAGIVASHDGKLVRIDTGISSYYGGVRSYLELKDGQATAWTMQGGGTWVSQVLPSP
jgi:hypothetical protein